MKFQYIGDKYHEGPESINFMGRIDFDLHGEFVEVEDEEACVKLQGNPCFIMEGEELPPRQPKRSGEFKTRTAVADEIKTLSDRLALLQAQFENENPAAKTQPAKKRPKKVVAVAETGPRFPGDL